MKDATADGNQRESIGQRLRRLRLERALSQRELSAPGVSYAYISRIEAGTRQPSVKALRKLAAKLGVSAEYLETGSEVSDADERELRLADAELALRLSGDSEAAERELRTLLDESVHAGDRDAATRARVGLAGAAAALGRHADSARLLEEAIAEGELSPVSRPDVYSSLGRAYSAVGRPRAAVELFERCLEDLTVEERDDPALDVRYASYLSYALTDSGDLAGAQEVLLRVLEQAQDLADPYTRIRLYWSLGRVAGEERRAGAALGYYRRAIALLEATDDELHLARANLCCAVALIHGGRAEEAGAYLELSEQLLGPQPDPADLGGLRTEQARRAVALGDGGAAVRCGRDALELLGDTHPAERGAAWHALAEGLNLQGDQPAASDAFGHAVEALTDADRLQEAAQAYRAWGRLLRAAGREEEALDALEKAADLAVRASPGQAARPRT